MSLRIQNLRLLGFAFFLMLVALLASCSRNGPVFPQVASLNDWDLTGVPVDPNSDRSPQVSGDKVAFQLRAGERVTQLVLKRDWQRSRKFLLGFDVRAREGLPSSPVVIAQLLRYQNGPQRVVSVALDAERGVTVAGQACIAPAALQDWHRVEIRVQFSDKGDGYLEAFCDRQPLFGLRDLQTGMPPVCRDDAGCVGEEPVEGEFAWQVGLMAERAVRQGVSVEMRRLQQRPLVWVPNRIAQN